MVFSFVQSIHKKAKLKYGTNLNCDKILGGLSPDAQLLFAIQDKDLTVDKGLGADYYSCFCQV